MSALNKVDIKKCIITPSEEAGSNKEVEDLAKNGALNLAESGSVVHVDYFEDILSPAITVYVKVSETSNLLSKLPIRGYEKVELEIGITEQLTFEFGDKFGNHLFVTGVEDINRTESQAIYTLVLSTVGNLRNEGARCVKHFPRATIKAHVEEILTDENGLGISDKRIEVDDTSNSYTFMGNNRKPFYTLTWLSPKAQPVKTGKVDGTSGFVFYEDYGGYKFKSIDSLLDAAGAEAKYLSKEGKVNENIPEFTFTTSIDRPEDPKNQQKILDFYIDKAVNIQKNLRVGLYSNLTTTVNPLNWKVENNTFKLKDQVNGSDGTSTMGVETPIPTSDVFGDEPSRRLVRITDHGMIDKDLKKDDDGEALTSGRDPQDMAKSFSRYSLLFQQSLNITIPCNNEIRVGQVVKVVLPDVGPSEQGDGGKDQKQADQELSGIYLVRAMRHHFELGDGKNVTSLNLVRDSYGLN